MSPWGMDPFPPQRAHQTGRQSSIRPANPVQTSSKVSVHGNSCAAPGSPSATSPALLIANASAAEPQNPALARWPRFWMPFPRCNDSHCRFPTRGAHADDLACRCAKYNRPGHPRTRVREEELHRRYRPARRCWAASSFAHRRSGIDRHALTAHASARRWRP